MNIDQILKKADRKKDQGDYIFALDIGTRTVVGIIGEKDGDKYRVVDCVVIPHTRRAMVDGQIEDIKQVSKIVGQVKEKLEQNTGIHLTRACIAAAGRALRTVNVTREFDVTGSEIITEEMLATMEMETISQAQSELDEETEGGSILFYCVGHNVVNYRLDEYKMISLVGHKGAVAAVDMVVAFLPSIVVEGLYSVMELNHLEVQSLTLEPIAAMNVIIPQEIRLINIALVDIGAGTSDIAVAKEGSIIAYAMATVAGDEITEEIIRNFLVDFAEAEQMKQAADDNDEITYRDIFGISHEITREEFLEAILPCIDSLAETVCNTIVKINGGAPQAVFLVGGGSLIKGLTTLVADHLGIDESRVAVGGCDFVRDVDTGGFKMGAEFITPVGIGVTALEKLGYDFSVITINDRKVRVFDTKKLTVYQLLTLAGYKAGEIMGHSGQGLSFTLNGNRVFRKGSMMTPAEVTVNGEPAGLTTVVTQGDNVKLIPAKNGENAKSRLKDEIDYAKYRSGVVSFAGKQYRFGLDVTVNGRKRPPDYEIQPLDEIVTGGVLTLGDLLNSIGVEYDQSFAVNGEYAKEGDLLHDGDRITIKLAAPVPDAAAAPAAAQSAAVPAAAQSAVAPATAQAAAVVSEHIPAPPPPSAPKPTPIPLPTPTPTPKPTPTPTFEPEPEPIPAPSPVPEPYYTPEPTPEPEPESGPDPSLIVPELTVTLNGSSLTLPEKLDGEPHIFLELMNYADIDTEKPQGTSVEITLNGRDASFGEELHNGDVAIVCWRN